MLARRTPPWCAWSGLFYNVVSNSSYSLTGRTFHRRWIGRNSKGSGGDLSEIKHGTCPEDLRNATKYHTLVDNWAEIQSKHLEHSSRDQELRLDILVPHTGLVPIQICIVFPADTYDIGSKYNFARRIGSDVANFRYYVRYIWQSSWKQ